MARKGKGQQRKDTFYHKAKIAGFRARSAYKLLQLNSKYEILQRSRVCVDLCAAPGSWMQVAKKYMPLSSIIVGVDLFPIKPIHGAISIVGDITTEKTRQDIKGTLKTWKADLVLHDGSPKVGQNWLHDAYQQNLLVLHSFKLACEMLQKGGWFITKVFRSKDFFNLEYVFKKLFKKVETTKPQASRYESAEIFVVCQGYLDPAKVDPQFFSAKHVFQEIKPDPTTKLNLLKPEKSKPKAEGYSEGATTLYNKVPVSEFMKSPNFVEVLQGASELDFDDEAFKNHPLTTEAIIENCKDIKVLGRKDLRLLLNWRKNMRADYKKKEEEKAALEKSQEDKEEEKSEGEVEEEELDKLQKQILELRTQQAQDEKRVRKRKLKERRKLEEKLRLKAVIPGDVGPTEGQVSGLFNLTRLAQVQSLDTMVDQDADMVLSESESEDDEDRPTHKRISKDERRLDKSGRFYLDGRSDEEFTDSDSGSEEEGLGRMRRVDAKIDADGDIGDNADASHPLITDLVGDSRQEKRARKAENWFSQDVFNDLETEADEDMELESAIAKFKAKGGLVQEKESKRQMKIRLRKQEKEAAQKRGDAQHQKMSDDTGNGDGDEDGDDDSDEESEDEGAEGNESGYTSDQERRKQKLKKKKTKKMMRKRKRSSDSEGGSDSESDSDSSESEEDMNEEEIQHGPQMPQKVVDGGIGGTLKHPKKKRKGKDDLDAVGLSLATKMIYSKKAKRDIMDGAWNRYMTGDGDDVPSWFAKDEKKFNQLRIEVEPEDLRMYRDRSKDVNAHTIKKVVEAKARKQRRVKKRLERARKKSEHITNNAELSEREKATEVKKLYKKAMDPLKKKETAYVVMKKRHGGHKPKGTKGPYKLVDKRLKKDTRGMKNAEKKKTGKSGGRGRGKKR